MDILYMDIVTVEFCQYSHQILVNMFLNSKRMGWDKVIRRGYLYISQLGETFYQGMQESLTVSTYYISIVTGTRWRDRDKRKRDTG